MEKQTPKPGITYRDVNNLLTNLGFQMAATNEEFHRIWRHPKSGTKILLPTNKENEPPLEADLHSVRTHLDYNGHMETSEFDTFVRTGKPVVR